jgi:threonine dehydratase
VDDVQLVSDEQMLDAIRFLLFHEQVIAEPAAAATTAAILANSRSGRTAVALVTGSNISADVLKSALCR